VTVLVTGTAGFIGFHVARRLLERGETVVGVDNLNAYYDPSLKRGWRSSSRRRPTATPASTWPTARAWRP